MHPRAAHPSRAPPRQPPVCPAPRLRPTSRTRPAALLLRGARQRAALVSADPCRNWAGAVAGHRARAAAGTAFAPAPVAGLAPAPFAARLVAGIPAGPVPARPEEKPPP